MLTVIGVVCGLACLAGGVMILVRAATHQRSAGWREVPPPKKTALDIAEEHQRDECPCRSRPQD